jgi:hypothetical protein
MSIKVTIEVDGTKNDVAQLRAVLRGLLNEEGTGIENIALEEAELLASEGAGKGGRKRRQRREGAKRAPRGQGIIAQVGKLNADGYFTDWRSAADVKTEMESDGRTIDSRQIYSALKYHYDRKRLVRQESDGMYVYRMA